MACGNLLQLVTLVCWTTRIPSLIGISWLQALDLVKSSEFLEVSKTAARGEEKRGQVWAELEKRESETIKDREREREGVAAWYLHSPCLAGQSMSQFRVDSSLVRFSSIAAADLQSEPHMTSLISTRNKPGPRNANISGHFPFFSCHFRSFCARTLQIT